MSSNIATVLSESSTLSTTTQDTLRHLATKHVFQTASNIVAPGVPLSTVFASSNYKTAMTITNGSVGIGTTAPRAAVDVIGAILASGSVGIGTTIPSQSLHVNGYVRNTHPACYYTGSGGSTNNTGTGTWIHTYSSTAVYDIGSCLSSSQYYLPPVSGLYSLSASSYLSAGAYNVWFTSPDAGTWTEIVGTRAYASAAGAQYVINSLPLYLSATSNKFITFRSSTGSCSVDGNCHFAAALLFTTA